LFFFNNNTIDENALEKFANASPVIKSRVNVQALTPWKQYFLGFGPKFNLHAKKYTLWAAVVPGINFLQSASYSQFVSVYFYKRKSLNTNSFGICTNVGTDIVLTDGLWLNISAGYYYSTANYGGVVLNDINGNVLQLKTQQVLEVSVFNLMLEMGLRFRLSKPK